MSAEGRRWLVYAQENLRAAALCLRPRGLGLAES
jgi:hypothetical protein